MIFLSLPGDFSGLHLESIMYVAFQYIDPSTSIGINLSREYEPAKGVAALAARRGFSLRSADFA